MISYSGKNRTTLNYLKAMYFDHPEWTPYSISIMPRTWMKYREDLEDLILSHPRSFPGYKKGDRDFDRVDDPFYEEGQKTDCWGTVWNNVERGLDSYPIRYPLEDWEHLKTYTPPDPLKDDILGPRDWHHVARQLEDARKRGDIAGCSPLPHGFMYMRLYYLHGFENLMMDMAMDDPRLWDLIKMVETYNRKVVEKCVEMGSEMLYFGDDLGLQNALPISPEMWRKYLKPSFDRIYRPARERDIPIYMHTDGHILEIIPDLVDVGVTVLNPQFRANGLEGLKEVAVGRVALNQDLDRQLFPFATASEIEDHIHEAHDALSLPEGGLMFYVEFEQDVPLETMDVICTTLEKVCNPPQM
ncbi:MAG: hypothetical protein GXO76_14730 [Calditrichaeota bacterium]|nr:hypothetical protein [Calditrichota bacterium]